MTLKTLIILLCCALSANVVAGRMGNDYWDNEDTAYVATLNVGPAWMRVGETQTFQLQSDIIKTYTANRSKAAIAVGELFLGFQKVLNSRLQGQLGLALGGTSSVQLKGNIYEDGNSNFNNFTYSYNVHQMHLVVKSKLLIDMKLGYDAIPYLSGGIGVGRNYASSFSITPLIVQEIPAPLFESATKTAFTCSLGAGLQLPLASNWMVGIGYEFMSWGKSQLGRAPGQTINKGVAVSNITSSEFQLSLTYLI